MKYFTRDLINRFGSPDASVANAASAEWDEAVDRYDDYLQLVRPELPATLWSFLHDFYLHDARVLGIGKPGQNFLVALQLDVPPQELLIISYALVEEPVIDTAALAPEDCCAYMAWLYDEIESIPAEGPKQFRHAILFSNGWKITLRARDVQVTTAQPVYPVPRFQSLTVPPPSVPQTA
jgi:hypothetical protein